MGLFDGLLDLAGPLLGGLLESDGSRRASNAQTRAQEAAIAEQRRQFDLIMGMQQPYQQVGTQALNSLARLYGYTPGQTAAPAAPQRLPLSPTQTNVRDLIRGRLGAGQIDPGGTPGTGALAPAPDAAPLPTGLDVFTSSPDYEFRRGEGMRGIENSFAARGGAASGNALRALNEFNSGLASTEFGNFFNRQAALAGIGQTATNNASGFAQNTGANIGNLLQNQGDARASGIAGQTNAWSNALQGLLSGWNRNRVLGG